MSWGEDGGAPPAPPAPIAPVGRPSGGFPGRHPWIDRPKRRKRPEDEEVQHVIQEVALRQVERLEKDRHKRFEELLRELEARNIEWEARYLTLLNEEREYLIHQEIGRLLRKKLQDEEDEVILSLMALL